MNTEQLTPHQRAALDSQRLYMISTCAYLFPKATQELKDHLWELAGAVLIKCVRGQSDFAAQQEAMLVWLVDNHALLNPNVPVEAIIQPFEILMEGMIDNLDEILSPEDDGEIKQAYATAEG